MSGREIHAITVDEARERNWACPAVGDVFFVDATGAEGCWVVVSRAGDLDEARLYIRASHRRVRAALEAARVNEA
jgi:hypothetical protein